MGVTNDERRRVAEKLREYASWDDEEECLVDCTDWGESVLNLLGCGDTEGECYAALADLIEPSCDRDAPQKVAEEMFGKMRHSTKEEADAYEAMLKSMSVELHPVDRDALLELADEMDRRQRDAATAATDGVVDAWCLREYANRIREACGEAVRNG